jgi:hypothetical protein
MRFNFALALTLLLQAPSAQAAAPKALIHAHAHNDYNHKRPLLDALEHGFASIEADVFLKDGQLLVGHTPFALRPDRTLKSLYLDPLQKHIAANHGHVFAGPERLTLLVDFKTAGPPTYAALARLLAEKTYDGLFSDFADDRFTPRLVDVVVTGNRPITEITADHNRRVAIDGRLTDTPPTATKELFPLISENWQDHFKWRGIGPMPAADRLRLSDMTKRVHAQGRRLRFWGAPDSPAVWIEQQNAGVDLLNADNIIALQSFLRVQPNAASPTN